MKLLNVGCGGCRPVDEIWTHLDCLREEFKEGTPERASLDAHPNYVEHNIFSGPLPFDECSFNGILLSHCAEHFDAQKGWRLLQNCCHVLTHGGSLMVSVPDASYFRKTDAEDTNKNWQRLYGVTDPKNPIPTWRQAALFFEQHPMVFTEDSMWCFLRQAGFPASGIRVYKPDASQPPEQMEMAKLLNRLPFSLVMTGVKE